MPNELTSKQCQKYQEEHWGIEWYFDNGIYYVHHRGSEAETQGYTLESAFTAHRDKNHPDWTPPDVHDAEWALEYAKEQRLTLQLCPDSVGSTVVQRDGIRQLVQKHLDENIVTTIERWKREYDPDKPDEDTEPRSDVHDAEWALRYMLEHCMSFGKASVWSAGAMTKDVYHDGTIEGIVKAVYQWQLIYDLDKPVEDPELQREPEEPTEDEKALALVGELSQILKGIDHGIIQSVIARIRNLPVKEADHVD